VFMWALPTSATQREATRLAAFEKLPRVWAARDQLSLKRCPVVLYSGSFKLRNQGVRSFLDPGLRRV
jgi:hypothetical protein